MAWIPGLMKPGRKSVCFFLAAWLSRAVAMALEKTKVEGEGKKKKKKKKEPSSFR